MISINLLPDVKKDLLKVRRERNMVVSISVIAVGVSVGILVILGIWMGSLAVIKASAEGRIKQAESTIETAKSNDQLDQYLTIQNQLAQIDGLKSAQPIYSRIMDYLIQLNPAYPNNVLLSSVQLISSSSEGNETGEITMTMDGTVGNFASLDVYKNTLVNAQIIYESKDEAASTSSDITVVESGNSSNAGEVTGSSAEGMVQATRENLFTNVTVDESSLGTDKDDPKVTFSITVTFNPAAFSPEATNIRLEVPRETTSDGDRNAPTFNAEEMPETDDETVEGGM